MRIGIVCYPTYGGSGVVATEIGMSLAKKGHEVHFVSYSQPARLDIHGPNTFFHEVTFLNYPLFEYPPYELALVSKLVDVIKHKELDLLHVHYAIPHAFAAYMAKEILAEQGIFIPIITTLHGTDITLVGKDESYEPSVTFSINKSDAVTAVSEFLKEETYKHFQVKKEIEVIPNFVEVKRFKKKSAEDYRKAMAPNNEKILVHVSNFRPVKRVEDVVRIFNEVRKKFPSKLLLVGDGPDRHHVERLCREMQFCNDLQFLGKVSAVEEVLSIADLFLLPSETESFGLSALEAMACSVPVISSNAGGLPEVNVHGKTGFLADVGDVASMSKYALELLGDEEKLIRFKDNARAHAMRFHINKIMPQYQKLYERLIKENSYSTV